MESFILFYIEKELEKSVIDRLLNILINGTIGVWILSVRLDL